MSVELSERAPSAIPPGEGRGGPLMTPVPAGGWPTPVADAMALLEGRAAAATTLPVDARPLGLPAALAAPPVDAPPPTWQTTLVVRLGAGAVLVVAVGARPCGGCLDRRWLALRPVEERHAIEDRAAPDAFVAGADPWLTPFAMDAFDAVVRHAAERPGTVYELRLGDLSVARHGLIADSACPDCAEPADDAPEPIVLRSRIKPTPTTYRLRTPVELELPVDGLANPVCGALGTAAVRAYHCTATAPVSGFFRVRSKYDLHEMWWSGHGDSYGESELLAVLEGLERYAGQFPRARRSVVTASAADLGETAFDPRNLGYAPEFYAEHGLFYEPYTPDLPMRWVWGWSMRDEVPRLLPEQLVYYLDWRPGRKFVQECSNGCASGSCMEEALLHGLLELMERDAFLLCWFGAARLPEIDLRSVRSARTRFMADRVRRLGYRVRLFDMRVDLPVPVVMAVAERRDGTLGTLCFSAGASLDPEDAVRAALCEAASYVPGFDERVAAKLPDLRRMAADSNEVLELSHHALLYGLPEMAPRADFLFQDAPLCSMDDLYGGWLRQRGTVPDLADDVRILLGLVPGDVLVVDQTCPEQRSVGLTTVATIAPGLIPIDFGWRRQRVLASDRLRAFLDGELDQVWPRADGFGATGLHPYPHPFP